MAEAVTGDLGYVHLESCVGGHGVSLDIGATSLYSGCRCEGSCASGTCTCTSAYDDAGLLREDYLASASAPVFECGSSCGCASVCLARPTQRQPVRELRVCRTAAKGLGVFTEVDIPRGAFIGEYVGEVISSTQAKHRLQSLAEDEACYVMVVKEHVSSGRVLTTNVDATLKGNIMRFVNHSCSPNMALVPVRADSIVPRLCLFACRNIGKGEEVCFSYFGRCATEAAASGELKLGKKQCFCGSEECIGFLPLEG